MPMHALSLDFAPWRLSGLVLGTMMNDSAALSALGAAVDAPPYRGAPKAPVLYIKPRNTLAARNAPMPLPAGVPALQIGASVALVIGRTACRIPVANAMAHVAGLALVVDLCVPMTSFYRPGVRMMALDGSCRIAQPVPLAGRDANALTLQVHIDGTCRQTAGMAGFIRPAAHLLADVSEFMTLRPGDVLLLGVPHGAPLAGAGQWVAITLEGIGRIEFEIGAAA